MLRNIFLKSSLFFPLGFKITFAKSDSTFGKQSTYLHPLGGTEIEHTISRKNTIITGSFELMYIPTEGLDITNESVQRNIKNINIMRILNIYKVNSIPAFYFSNEIFTPVKIDDFKVSNSGKRPFRPIVNIKMREIPLMKSRESLYSGLLLGTVSALPNVLIGAVS